MEHKDPIYIFGHKNPDADSICGAIAYAEFKKAMGQEHYLPARCGNSNARINTILEYFDQPLPKFIGDVRPRVKDIMVKTPHKAQLGFTCAEALETLNIHDLRALPVVNDANELQGIITIFTLGQFYLPTTQEPAQMRNVHETSIGAIVRTLGAEALNLVNPDQLQDLYVRVGAMDINTFGKFTREKSISPDKSVVVVGDRHNIHEKSIDHKVRLLVISGGSQIDEALVKKAKDNEVSIIRSQFDAATTTWLIKSASLIKASMTVEAISFTADDSLAYVKKKIASSPNTPIFTVVNDKGELIGTFTKTDVLHPVSKKIVLVDHNELSQAVDGAGEITISEIIDHHKLGNVPTEQPILFINEPVGSSNTIIADMFRKHGMAPTPTIAGIMMSGIISDTLSLKSPTTTEKDKEILSWLEQIAGVPSEDLANTIFSSGSLILTATPDVVITSDCKAYNRGELHYCVSQVEELGFDNFWKHAETILQALDTHRESNNYNMACLLVTDINTHNSKLLVSGNQEFINNISYPSLSSERIFDMPGIVSRKKQLIPYITQVFKSIEE